MHKTIRTIKEEIQHYVATIEATHGHDYSTKTELAIRYISERLEYVKERFEEDRSITECEEIFYFKNIKAHLLALIQFYTLVQKIELRKPPLRKKKLKKYYLNELYKTKKKLRKQHFYYNYYKANLTQLDDQLFRRIREDRFTMVGDFILDIDKRSNTPTLHIFVQIEALELLRIHLKKKIKKFDHEKLVIAQPAKSNIKWTASKTDLIELIYALHAAGIFNNGKADIKEIAECLQDVFDVELGQYNRVFYDIRIRKNSKTKLLDGLKEALIKRINETGNELFI